jgi:hypothetical protein
MADPQQDTVRNVVDTVAVATGGAVFLELLPIVTLFLTAIWMLFRVIEMKTSRRIFWWVCKKFKRKPPAKD